MNIQVPWKIRSRGSRGQGSLLGNLLIRRRFHDELNVAKRPTHALEDDLDHLGMMHKNRS